MQFQVKGRNLEVSDAIRSYAEAKLGKLERQLNDPRVELELAVERNPSIAANHVAEATIWTKGPVLRAREASSDMHASIDQLVDKLERQVTRYKRRGRHRRPRRAAASAVGRGRICRGAGSDRRRGPLRRRAERRPSCRRGRAVRHAQHARGGRRRETPAALSSGSRPPPGRPLGGGR